MTPTPSSYLEALRLKAVQPGFLAQATLQKAILESDFSRSVRNCHHQGLDSIVLFHSSGQGMIRFYYAHAKVHQMGDLLNPEGHFTIGVHNHKYNIAKIPLMDSILNITTREVEQGSIAYRYDFGSALRDGEISLTEPQAVRLAQTEIQRLRQGDVVIMDAEDLHTVSVSNDQDSAWMVIEGPVRKEVQTRIYSPRPDLRISQDDLYEPMSKARALELTERVLAQMEAY